MKKYLFAFDLDGTLLNEKGVITQDVLDGLEKIRSLGHQTAIITGRSWNMTQHIYKETKMQTPVGVFNGGVVYSANDDSFKTMTNYIDEADVKSIIKNDDFINNIASFTVETIKEPFVDKTDSRLADVQRKYAFMEPKDIKTKQNFDDVVAFLCEVGLNEEKEVKALSERLQKTYSNLVINYWYSDFSEVYILEITKGESRKDYALGQIATHLGIPMKNTIAFGDEHNDWHMIKNAAIGIVMKNGAEGMKEIADQITEKPNSENGLMNHIFTKILV